MSRRVLVADDEPGIRLVLASHLRRRGWQVEEATTGTEALERLRVGRYDAVVLDQRMPGCSGIEIAREVGCDAPTFLFSAFLEPSLRAEVAELGCTSIDKTDIDDLLRRFDLLAGGLEEAAGTPPA